MRRAGTSLALPALLLAFALPAHAATALPAVPGHVVQPPIAACDSQLPYGGDLDGDQVGDLVFGLPLGYGAVDVHFGNGGAQHLTMETLGLGSGRTASELGSAIAMDDLDADGCMDLIITAPGAALVVIAYGSRLGITGRLQVLRLPGTVPDDRLGAALLVLPANALGSQYYIYAGAPGRTVNGHAGAGAVVRWRVSPVRAGSPLGVRIGSPLVITQDSPGVPDVAESGDGFGEVLAPDTDPRLGLLAGGQGVAIGDPGESVGSAKEAGAVFYLPLRRDDTFGRGTMLTQASPGIDGVPEAGDFFGAALHNGWIGIPGEDVGSVVDAGAVMEPEYDASLHFVRGVSVTEDSADVPDEAEAGEFFGASLGDENCAVGASARVIGAPGETIDGAAEAGAVFFFGGCGPTDGWGYEGHGFPGTAEAGDQFGTALGQWFNPPRGGSEGRRLLVGAPGKDLPEARDAGVVETSDETFVGIDPRPSLGWLGRVLAA